MSCEELTANIYIWVIQRYSQALPAIIICILIFGKRKLQRHNSEASIGRKNPSSEAIGLYDLANDDSEQMYGEQQSQFVLSRPLLSEDNLAGS